MGMQIWMFIKRSLDITFQAHEFWKMNEISIESQLHFTVKSFFCFLEIDEESA